MYLSGTISDVKFFSLRCVSEPIRISILWSCIKFSRFVSLFMIHWKLKTARVNLSAVLVLACDLLLLGMFEVSSSAVFEEFEVF